MGIDKSGLYGYVSSQEWQGFRLLFTIRTVVDWIMYDKKTVCDDYCKNHMP